MNNVMMGHWLSINKYITSYRFIVACSVAILILGTTTQLLLPTLLFKNIAFVIMCTLCMGLVMTSTQSTEDPYQNRKWLRLGTLFYQTSFILSVVWPEPIKWLQYTYVIAEYIGLLFATIFVFTELLGIEKQSGNVGLNADVLMIFAGFSIAIFLAFSQSIFNFAEAHSEPVIRSVTVSILALWFFVISLAFAAENPEDKITNVLRLAIAITFGAFYVFRTYFYIDPNKALHADLWQSISRISIMACLSVLLVYTRYSPTATETFVQVKHKTLSYLLYMGIGTLLCSIPFGLLWAYVRGDKMPFMALVICSMMAMSLLTFRLFMLIRLALKQSKQYWLESRRDSITGLDNRRSLIETIAQASSPPYLIAVFDLNDFKAINDLYGHTIGDQLLRKFGKTLQARANLFFGLNDVPPTVARLTGDEFAVIVHQQIQEDLFARQILNALPEWWQIEQHRIYVTCSIGISIKQELNLEQRLREADYAVQVASRSNRQIVPQAHLNYTSIGSRQQMRQYVQDAIRLNHIFIQLQPIYSLADERLVGFEALIRLLINGQTVMPAHFMDVVHSDGLHKKITEMVINEVAKVHLNDPHVRININLPPELLAEDNSVKWLIDLFNKLNIDITRITLEVLESESLDSQTLCAQVQQLCDAGFRIALDDFGSGYSSLSRFAELPIDYIKIDRSLVQATARNDMAPIESAVTLAEKHQCITVAEGVETELELNLMKKLGIDYIQGYLLGRPMNINEAVLLDSTHSYTEALVKARLANNLGALEEIESANKTLEMVAQTGS